MDTEEMGIVAVETVGAPAVAFLTPEAERARNEALRAEVIRVRELCGSTAAEIAREAGIAGSTFSAWLAGKYNGRVRNVDDDVERWLRNLDTAKQAAATLREAPGFIATPAAEKLFDAFSYAQHAPDLVVVSGAAGVGKTTAIGAYRARKPNVWVVTGEPCISTPRMMLDEIAELLGLSEGRSTHRISRSIVTRMRGTKGVLVVDEAQHLNTPTLDQLRTLHDLSGVGVVLVGNEKVQARIDGGARKSEFAQIFSRVGMRVPMPKALRADMDALLDAWGIKGADERKLLAAIASRPGALRVMTKTIRIADMQAGAAEEPLGVRHIKMAWEHLAAQKLDVAA